jgi:hypothetical protein
MQNALYSRESRDALLAAIAKVRGWIDDIRLGRIASFAKIAEREAQGERHIRLLAPLAFCRPASLRRSSMEPRLRTSRSPASPGPCPIPGVSRSGTSDCHVALAIYAGVIDSGDAMACSKHAIKIDRLAASSRNH